MTPSPKPALPRTGMRRLILTWEYRHIRGLAYVRFAGAGLLLIFGGLLLPYVSWWAALPIIAAVAGLLVLDHRSIHVS
jgi:hypothetical protein